LSPKKNRPAEVTAREAQFIVPNYARTAFHPVSGRGARLVDADGIEYWDLLAGIAVNALGHSHPRLVRELRSAAEGLLHVSNLYYHPWQGLLAEKLVRVSGLSRAFFCNSGTEANEAALKFARLKNPGRGRIVALEGSFHGRTFGGLSITGTEKYRKPFEPLLPGVVFVTPNDTASLSKAITKDTSAVIMEPIMGEGGVVPLKKGFMEAARKEAGRAGAMLIFDEIQCGLGRTGKLFAFQHSGVVPDMVTLAKPLGGGLPLGAVVTGPAVEGLVKPGHHGTTFGGNPVACRMGLAVLEEMERAKLLERVTELGNWLGSELRALQKTNAAIKDVRGCGLIWGIEIDREAAPIARRFLDKGYVVGTAQSNVVRLLPPYIVQKKALAGFVKTLDLILKEKSQ
jgi:predicted acetylornithine/succinylornithine family transaminase